MQPAEILTLLDERVVALVLVGAAGALALVMRRRYSLTKDLNRQDHEALAEHCKKTAQVYRELADRVENEDKIKAERLRDTARQQDRMAREHSRWARR